MLPYLLSWFLCLIFTLLASFITPKFQGEEAVWLTAAIRFVFFLLALAFYSFATS